MKLLIATILFTATSAMAQTIPSMPSASDYPDTSAWAKNQVSKVCDVDLSGNTMGSMVPTEGSSEVTYVVYDMTNELAPVAIAAAVASSKYGWANKECTFPQ